MSKDQYQSTRLLNRNTNYIILLEHLVNYTLWILIDGFKVSFITSSLVWLTFKCLGIIFQFILNCEAIILHEIYVYLIEMT